MINISSNAICYNYLIVNIKKKIRGLKNTIYFFDKETYLNLLYFAVIISGDSVRSTGSLARILTSVFSNQVTNSSMIRWNCSFDIRAVCNCSCQCAATLQTFTHLVFATANLSLSCVARSNSSV